jgi:hypothetical protein
VYFTVILHTPYADSGLKNYSPAPFDRLRELLQNTLPSTSFDKLRKRLGERIDSSCGTAMIRLFNPYDFS